MEQITVTNEELRDALRSALGDHEGFKPYERRLISLEQRCDSQSHEIDALQRDFRVSHEQLSNAIDGLSKTMSSIEQRFAVFTTRVETSVKVAGLFVSGCVVMIGAIWACIDKILR